MPEKPLLTVMVVAYNHASSIAKCLDSVLSQRTKYPYIIWVIEDGSTDDTLKICQAYAKKYPRRIKFTAQKHNTKGEHVSWAFSKITTPYVAVLDGDDTWSDPQKIQVAINMLEKNPQYMTFAHDTLYNYLATDEQKSLVHDIHGANIGKSLALETAPYLHTSARIHRNVAGTREHLSKFQNTGDLYIYYYFLDKGPLYYHDTIMSVYNINGKGSWSSLSSREQAIATDTAFKTTNQMLDYRHDTFFSQKVTNTRRLRQLKRLLGVRLGWWAYMAGTKRNYFR